MRLPELELVMVVEAGKLGVKVTLEDSDGPTCKRRRTSRSAAGSPT